MIDRDGKKDSMKKNTLEHKVCSLLLLPCTIYFFLVCYAFIVDGDIRIWWGDVVIFGAVLSYLAFVLMIRKSREALIRFVLLLSSIIVVVVGLEIYLNVFYPSSNGPLPSMRHKNTISTEGLPGLEEEVEFTVNKYGLRGPEIDINETDLNILAIGGSTTECLFVSDKLTWPWLFQDKLAMATGKNVFVGNAGRSGQLTLNHVYLLENYYLVPEFDWIVILCGINDLGRLLRNDYEKIRKKIKYETLYNVADPKELFYRRFRTFQLLRTMKRKGDYIKRIAPGRAGPSYNELRNIRKQALKRNALSEVPYGKDIALEQYESTLKEIIWACKKKGKKLIFLTQPTLWDKEMVGELELLLWEHVDTNSAFTPEILSELMDEYNQVLISVCQEENVICIDLASMLPKDSTVMYDDCHFNVNGCEILSNILVEKLKEYIQ